MKRLLPLLLISVLFLSGCSVNPETISFESMDTFMQVSLYGDKKTAEAVQNEILRLEALFNANDPDSKVSELNQSGFVEDEDVFKVLEGALKVSQSTDGALDPSVYPLVEEWGFISRDFRIPDKSTIDELLQHVDYTQIALNFNRTYIPEKMKLDLGAVAKGYAADRAKEILAENEVKSAILNLGGTVAAVGTKPDGSDWKVGISDPESTGGYFATVTLRDKIVATSGSYERYFEQDGKRYCHILDPKTGMSADSGVVSVSIISDNGLYCDALSTALFVMGAEKAQAYWKNQQDLPPFDYILLDDTGKVYVTDGVEITLTDKEKYEVVVVSGK